ncbi:MAG TPA: hypothetical protein VM492_14830 [Sumerlaeia bacterium]|nr:hypothetical protein [Sumerlaeia bacterium]
MDPQEESRKAPDVETMPCRLCEGGAMRRAAIKPYNVNAAIALLVVGGLCLVTGVLSLIGLVLVLMGGYFALAKKDVWLCDRCNAMVERL